jgi:hypothetical protein
MNLLEISVGRASRNDVVIQSEEVSRFHCVFSVHSDGSCSVTDLNSKNGVYVNGKRIQGRHALQKGDALLLGKTQFFWEEVLLETQAAPPRQNATPREPQAAQQTHVVRAGKMPRGMKIAAAVASVLLVISALWSAGLLEGVRAGFSEVTGQWALKNDPIVYDTECLKDSVSNPANEVIQVVGQMKRDVLNLESVQVTMEEELELGRQCKAQIEEMYTYSKEPRYTDRVAKIFARLTTSLSAPRFKYECHVMESAEVNAFTAGGHIFILTGIIDFAQSDDEIACILGHEIFHNELGHMTDYMRERRLSEEWFGEYSEYYNMASDYLSQAFNQENEVYSDLHGMDLAVKAGYDGCAGIGFWERMAREKDTDRRTLWRKFTSTHPFSEERAHCNRAHIEKNYYHVCH